MDKDQAIQVIIFECEEIDGFLVKLRSREINDEQFKRLFEAIQVYRDAIIGENYISRRVAGSLFYLVNIMDGMTQHFEHHSLPDKERITEANVELWNLVESIYHI